jgi:hypothetical protein
MIEVRTYELRSPSVIDAVQWKGEHPEDLAEAIVNWVNRDGDGELAGYSSTELGPLGPEGSNWGSLTLKDGDLTVEVHPYDYLIRESSGKFFVIEPVLFESVYHPITEGALP